MLDMSIAENLVLEVRNEPRFEKRYLLDNEQVHLNARRLVEEYSISCGGVDAPARTLSGGNMQKLILAKVLVPEPEGPDCSPTDIRLGRWSDGVHHRKTQRTEKARSGNPPDFQ